MSGAWIAAPVVSMVLLAIGCLLAVKRDLRHGDTLRLATVLAVWVLYLLLAGLVVVSAWLGIVPLPLPAPASVAVGGVLVAAGLGFVVAGVHAFHSFRRMSGMQPDSLVQHGVYRISRNPQNLGWGLALLGLGIWGRSALALGLALFFWVAFAVYVPVEERLLERVFGERYRAYRARTPRFLGLPRTPRPSSPGGSHSPHRHAHGSSGMEPGRGGNERRLLLVLALVCAYMSAEALGGWWSGSLALLADAGHMFSDAGALGLAWLAMRSGRRLPTATHTFGFRRVEVLAALANGLTLLAIGIATCVEAVERLGQPLHIRGGVMIGVAAGGLLVMLVSAALLHEGRGESLNVRAVWLHVLTDAVGSVGVIATGGLIWAFGWTWVDLVASLAIAALIFGSAWGLLAEVGRILMEAAPGELDVGEVRGALEALPEVAEVHDLHVWTITSGLVSLSCHLVAQGRAARDRVLQAARKLLRARFGIEHVVLQVEEERCGGGCPPP